MTFINRLNGFNNNLLKCDILPTKENPLNGNPSDIFARFNITEKPYERVTYFTKEPAMKKLKKHELCDFNENNSDG